METRSYVRYILKKSSGPAGGIGFEIEAVLAKGDTKEDLIKLGEDAIEAVKDLMNKKVN